MEGADYVVLDRWERDHHDEAWYEAQDSKKPTVTPEFLFDSYEKGMLMDPNDYPMVPAQKPRKGRPRGEVPKWLRRFKEAECVKSLQYIAAMFQKNAALKYDLLAKHLYNKVRRSELKTAQCQLKGFAYLCFRCQTTRSTCGRSTAFTVRV